MNPELLKLYIALQPLFRERMGEWQWWDKWYDPDDTDYGYVMPRQVIEFRKPDSDCHYYHRIPRTIDDSSPEAQKRSLWGMVNWNEFNFENLLDGSGNVLAFQCKTNGDFSFKGTPTEVILRALCAQEGVEI